MRPDHPYRELIDSPSIIFCVYRCDDAFINLDYKESKRDSDLIYESCLPYIYYHCNIINIHSFRMPGASEPKNASVNKNKQDKDTAAAAAAADNKKNDEKKNNEKKNDNNKNNEKKNDSEKSSNGLDEKGNPLPEDNPDGGDPKCPDGYKIDYQFDPINDPINPLFRCIPALKDPTDGVAGKLLAMANNTSGGVENLASGNIPVFGGTKRRSRTRRRTRHRHRRRRSSSSTRHRRRR